MHAFILDVHNNIDTGVKVVSYHLINNLAKFEHQIGRVITYIISISILGNLPNYFWNYNRRISVKVIYQHKTLFLFSTRQLFNSLFAKYKTKYIIFGNFYFKGVTER